MKFSKEISDERIASAIEKLVEEFSPKVSQNAGILPQDKIAERIRVARQRTEIIDSAISALIKLKK